MQPFYKTSSEHKKYSNSGIGLALVNSLVQLLDGSVNIDSSHNNGTTFRIILPIVENNENIVYTDQNPAIVNSLDVVADTIYTLNNSDPEQSAYTLPDRDITILLVEDNPDINKLLKSKLSKLYKVKNVYDGQEAIKILKDSDIDIVISDIMMPYMDGYELTQFIKTSRQYSHIPVILITSQISKESEIKGFSTGADAYIEKPFTFEELNIRISNLLKAKNSIKTYYHDMKIFELNDKLNSKDESFIQTLTQYVLDNIQNTDLNVDNLAEHANISRTQLYNRLKKLLNLSATEFVNKIKIDVAKHKIIETNLTFSEISWQLGFSNPSYFSKTFKRFCGVSPIDFKNGKSQSE